MSFKIITDLKKCYLTVKVTFCPPFGVQVCEVCVCPRLCKHNQDTGQFSSSRNSPTQSFYMLTSSKLPPPWQH